MAFSDELSCLIGEVPDDGVGTDPALPKLCGTPTRASENEPRTLPEAIDVKIGGDIGWERGETCC